MIEVVDGRAALALADELAGVYERAFGEPATRFREEQLPRHATREGFRMAVMWRDLRVVGFGYGYTGRRGQWWTDRVAQRAPAEIVAQWVDGHFEVVELAVEPAAQGTGIGARLHDALLAGLPHRRALLSTYRDDRPATRLYRRKGWRMLMPALEEDADLYGLELPPSA